MEKCCPLSPILKNHRRINGLQFPLNLQQVFSWIVLVITALLNFTIVSHIQFEGLKVISLITFGILYISHIASHVTALVIDPAEDNLRSRETSEVPEFDRSVHAHVIENGRCHLCNIYTSNKKTKHCGLCNKCVYEFDHHCKWLNNCIGQRNYPAFIGCVTTALFISTFTFALCIADIVLFFKQPQLLSSEAQKFFDCNSADTINWTKYCQGSIAFITFLIILCISGLAMACALLHLCCFHIYISFLGISTYEYITRNSNIKTEPTTSCRQCIKKDIFLINRKNNRSTPDELKHDASESSQYPSALNKSETNVSNLLTILRDSEIMKAVKIFSTDKNKVHPNYNSNTENLGKGSLEV